jgi:Protein of unknown function (DUF2752)
LVGSVVVLSVALLLDVRADEQVSIRGLSWLSLPQICACRAGLGVNCPACGMTRSLILLARGNLEGAWRAHHLGWLLGGLVLLQVPYRWLALRQHERPLIPDWIELWLGFTLVMLLLGNWAIDIGGCAGPTPVREFPSRHSVQRKRETSVLAPAQFRPCSVASVINRARDAAQITT